MNADLDVTLTELDSAGASNAVWLQDVVGAFSVVSTGESTIRDTTESAVVLENAGNVYFDDVDILNAGAASDTHGVDASNTNVTMKGVRYVSPALAGFLLNDDTPEPHAVEISDCTFTGWGRLEADIGAGISSTGTGQVTVLLANNTFTAGPGATQALILAAEDSGNLAGTVGGNTFNAAGATGPAGVQLQTLNNANATVEFLHNGIFETTGPGFLNVIDHEADETVFVRNNTITGLGGMQAGLLAQMLSSGVAELHVTNNQVINKNRDSVAFFTSGMQTGLMRINYTGNFGGAPAVPGHAHRFQTLGTPAICARIMNNDGTGNGFGAIGIAGGGSPITIDDASGTMNQIAQKLSDDNNDITVQLFPTVTGGQCDFEFPP
jgi:hypothetical protein